VIGAVLVASLAALAVGGLLCARRATFAAGLGLQATGAAAVAAAGFWFLGSAESAGAEFTSSFDLRLGVDPLSGLFLGALGLVAAPALVFAAGYLDDSLRGRLVAVLTAPFLLALALVVCARDPLSFLAGWESITLLSAAAILVWRGADATSRRTVFA